MSGSDPVEAETSREAEGLHIDMLDADRLRQWADNIATYGPDLTHWASPAFVSDWLRKLADNVEATVRAVGSLRSRCDDYLRSGGLFNPELAQHDAVRDLVLDLRGALDPASLGTPRAAREEITIPDAHQRVADRFRALAQPVPLSEAEKMPDYDPESPALPADVGAPREKRQEEACCGGTGFVAYWDGSAQAGEGCPCPDCGRGCPACEPRKPKPASPAPADVGALVQRGRTASIAVCDEWMPHPTYQHLSPCFRCGFVADRHLLKQLCAALDALQQDQERLSAELARIQLAWQEDVKDLRARVHSAHGQRDRLTREVTGLAAELRQAHVAKEAADARTAQVERELTRAVQGNALAFARVVGQRNALLQRVETLEGERADVRRQVLEEAAKLMCFGCARDLPYVDSHGERFDNMHCTTNELGGHGWWKCEALLIRETLDALAASPAPQPTAVEE